MRYLSLYIFLLSVLGLHAQEAQEAIRYSQVPVSGTAKGDATGGVGASLAADFTGVMTNPAVVATYRSSEMAFSAGINQQLTHTFLSSDISNNGIKINLPNAHVVFTNMRYSDSGKIAKEGVVAMNWALGYNTRQVFNYRSSFSASDINGTIIDDFLNTVNQGDGIAWDRIATQMPFDGAMAWEGYLINPISAQDSTHYNGIYESGMTASGIRRVRGIQKDFFASFGWNLSNRLYLGASIGIPSIRYSYTNTYVESDDQGLVDDFESLALREEVVTRGTGLYGKFGALYVPSKWLRLGASYQTPTYYGMRDAYNSSIETSFASANYSYDTPNGRFGYILVTPANLTASASMIGKLGWLSFDWDQVDYSTAQFDLESNSNSTADWMHGAVLNNQLSSDYGKVNNYRIGAELKLKNKQFLRGGYAYYGDPFKDPNTITGDNSRRIYSAGYGKHFDNCFVDFSVSRSYTEEEHRIYNAADAPQVKRTFEQVQIKGTIGWRF